MSNKEPGAAEPVICNTWGPRHWLKPRWYTVDLGDLNMSSPWPHRLDTPGPPTAPGELPPRTWRDRIAVHLDNLYWRWAELVGRRIDQTSQLFRAEMRDDEI